MATRVMALLVVGAMFLSCQKHGEDGFTEGRQTFRELLALRDQLSREFHETVGDVSVAANRQMTVTFVDSPLRSRTPEEKQRRADAVAAFVLKNYRRPVSSVSVEFASGTAGGPGDRYVGRPGAQATEMPAARGVAAAGTDPIAFAQRLTRDLYLRPLGLDRASLRIEADRFDAANEPHAFIVHVYPTEEAGAVEVLTVNIVRVGAFLQFVSASGTALGRAAAGEAVRERRRETAVNALRELGGHVTDGRLRPGGRPGFVELRFTHPLPPRDLAGTATGVFDEKSGLLVMFGMPAVRPEAGL